MARFLDFTVEGRGHFPTDMLRYDSCYPSDQESAVNMGLTHWDDVSKVRRVKLTKRIEPGIDPGPTTDRWLSFGWKVVEQHKF